MKLATEFCKFAKELYPKEKVLLHRPLFEGRELEYVTACINSNFVSSVGQMVVDFECAVSDFTGATYAIACVNGTTALHAALYCLGVDSESHVLTQALSFVATANAIAHCSAEPIFIDVDLDTMGMSSVKLENWLRKNTYSNDGTTFYKVTGKPIRACVPMHTFGFPARIEKILEICDAYHIPIIEDAAESLGSFVKNKHTGTFGSFGTFSFNGNKIITTGGGGMIITESEMLARKVKHLTTTAKVPHSFEFFHDAIGFNYRMPNLNAALGLGQIERLSDILNYKKKLHEKYLDFFSSRGIELAKSLTGDTSNYWLNAIILRNRSERDEFLHVTNSAEVMTRPVWALLSTLPMYKHCPNDGLKSSKWLADRVVNIPSSVSTLR